MNDSTTGLIYLVGLGPGSDGNLTPSARDALRKSDSIIGFHTYVEQITDLVQDKELISMELGQEIERAERAVDMANTGKTVAVVSSGDAGIYGMSGPVFKVLCDRNWDGISPGLETIPGISALQSSAALLGSPLMQDFCAVSLSDLMTPWQTICRRIEAAAWGDFVMVLYNPRSMRRTQQLLEARQIIMNHREASTPVGLVKDAFRINQQVTLTNLGDLEQASEQVNMVTTVVIGNSTTYIHNGHMVTPRGYGDSAIPANRRYS